MKTVRLRFTGEQASTFSTCNVGSVEPQGEFDVPEDQADRFLVRRDIELVSGNPRSRRTPKSDDQGGADTGSGDAGADVGERGALTATGTATGDPDPVA